MDTGHEFTIGTSDIRSRDPVAIARALSSCWEEAETQISLSSERQSSLRRTIASRILREAARGEIDEQVIRRRALLDLIPAHLKELPVRK